MKNRRGVLWAIAWLTLVPTLRAEDGITIESDLIYGRKDGMALTMDVLKPAKPNGAAVAFIMSGGWYSTWRDPKEMVGAARPFLDRGFTTFIVRHGSAPKYAVPDAISDVRRAMRFIHLKAKSLGVTSGKIGVWGGSAGGHLSLMLGTTGDDGDPKAKDEVLRQPSRISAVVALCPPSDLRGFTTDPPAIIKSIPALKPPLTFDAKLEPDCSPVLKATEKSAPTLIVHGDKDTLVPIDHGKKMVVALEKVEVPCKLITIEGAGHSFSGQQTKEIIQPAMVQWFEKYLLDKKTP